MVQFLSWLHTALSFMAKRKNTTRDIIPAHTVIGSQRFDEGHQSKKTGGRLRLQPSPAAAWRQIRSTLPSQSCQTASEIFMQVGVRSTFTKKKRPRREERFQQWTKQRRNQQVLRSCWSAAVHGESLRTTEARRTDRLWRGATFIKVSVKENTVAIIMFYSTNQMVSFFNRTQSNC